MLAALWGSITAYATLAEGTYRQQWQNIGLKAAYVLLQQIDLVLTVLAVQHGFRELNPLMVKMLSAPLLLIMVKVVLPLVVAWFVPGRLLLPASVLLLLVLFWNLKEIFIFLF
ncbi:MAG: DUF5658 family protein [Chloroflexota bacterium]